MGEGAEDEDENGTEPVQPTYKKIQTFDNPNYGSTGNASIPDLALAEEANGNGGFVKEKNGLKQGGKNDVINRGMDQTAYETAIVPMQNMFGDDFISTSLSGIVYLYEYF